MSTTGLVNRIIFQLARARGRVRVSIRNKHFVVRIRDSSDLLQFVLWRAAERNEWEPATLDLFDRYIGRESIVLDLGAWVGITSLYAACRGRRVCCVEPDPVGYTKLIENISLSGYENLLAFNMAIAEADGPRQLGRRHSYGDTMSSLLPRNAPASIWTSCSSMPTLIQLAGADSFDFVKMDIEGYEYVVLPAMRDFINAKKPHLHLSLHPLRFPREGLARANRTLVDTLKSYAYCFSDDMRPFNLASIAASENLTGNYALFFTDRPH